MVIMVAGGPYIITGGDPYGGPALVLIGTPFEMEDCIAVDMVAEVIEIADGTTPRYPIGPTMERPGSVLKFVVKAADDIADVGGVMLCKTRPLLGDALTVPFATGITGTTGIAGITATVAFVGSGGTSTKGC